MKMSYLDHGKGCDEIMQQFIGGLENECSNTVAPLGGTSRNPTSKNPSSHTPSLLTSGGPRS